MSISRPMAGTRRTDAKDAKKGKRGRKGEQERVRKQGPVTGDRKKQDSGRSQGAMGGSPEIAVRVLLGSLP